VILVDTNVVLDVLTDDPRWAEWSHAQLEACSARDRLAINDVIYAELSVGYDRIEDVDKVLEVAGLSIAPIPRAALFLAGKVFKRYRALAGQKTGVLPDFFIGSHAAVAGATLLTRDGARYRRFFPTLTLLTPTK
jgi:predicted nucleic acid-binding protein